MHSTHSVNYLTERDDRWSISRIQGTYEKPINMLVQVRGIKVQ